MTHHHTFEALPGAITIGGVFLGNIDFEKLKKAWDPSGWDVKYKSIGFSLADWEGAPSPLGTPRSGVLNEEVLTYKNRLYVTYRHRRAADNEVLTPGIDVTYRLFQTKGTSLNTFLLEDAGNAITYRYKARSGSKPEEWMVSVTKVIMRYGPDPDLRLLGPMWIAELVKLFEQALE